MKTSSGSFKYLPSAISSAYNHGPKPFIPRFQFLVFLFCIFSTYGILNTGAQSIDQAQALLAIKKATGLSNPNMSSWDSNSQASLCNWKGITCFNNVVIELNTSGYGLSGMLPPHAFTNLTSLTSLDMSYNNLTGQIPELQMLTQLQTVIMASNDFTGDVPAWFQSLQTNRVVVDFTCNFLSGPYPPQYNDSTWSGNCFSTGQQHSETVCRDQTKCSDVLSPSSDNKGKQFPKGAIAGIAIGAILISSCLIFAFIIWRWKQRTTDKNYMQGSDDWGVPPNVRRFTLKEIQKATKSFSKNTEIGEGGFGKVYLAKLETGRHFAIKRASELSLQGTKEFRNEIALLSRLQHDHLVRLEGFCNEKDEQILVYEYMKNGNLRQHLFGNNASPLNWYRRLDIAYGVAQGLRYLHSFANPPVIHRDIKPSNILLDDKMVAKVSDFGISKADHEMGTHVSTRPAGTAGYLDPEYFLRRQLTTSSDVYSYGVVLLELLTGQLAINHDRLEDYNLVQWARKMLESNSVQSIIDPRLGTDYPLREYTGVLDIAIQCTAYERHSRPTMQVVVEAFQSILSGLTVPTEKLVVAEEELERGGEPRSQGSTSMTDARSAYGFKVEPR